MEHRGRKYRDWALAGCNSCDLKNTGLCFDRPGAPGSGPLRGCHHRLEGCRSRLLLSSREAVVPAGPGACALRRNPGWCIAAHVSGSVSDDLSAHIRFLAAAPPNVDSDTLLFSVGTALVESQANPVHQDRNPTGNQLLPIRATWLTTGLSKLLFHCLRRLSSSQLPLRTEPWHTLQVNRTISKDCSTEPMPAPGPTTEIAAVHAMNSQDHFKRLSPWTLVALSGCAALFLVDYWRDHDAALLPLVQGTLPNLVAVPTLTCGFLMIRYPVPQRYTPSVAASQDRSFWILRITTTLATVAWELVQLTGKLVFDVLDLVATAIGATMTIALFHALRRLSFVDRGRQ